MESFDFATEKTNEELEASLIQDPKNDVLWDEYGQWLREHGNPRGELVLLNREPESSYISNEKNPLYDFISTKHCKRWFGDLFDKVPSLTWYRGFPIAMEAFYEIPEPRLTRLLAARSFRFLRELSLVGTAETNLSGLENLTLLEKLKLNLKASASLRTLPPTKPRLLNEVDLSEKQALFNEELIADFGSVGWWSELRKVYLGSLSIDDQEELLKCPEPFQTAGPRRATAGERLTEVGASISMVGTQLGSTGEIPQLGSQAESGLGPRAGTVPAEAISVSSPGDRGLERDAGEGGSLGGIPQKGCLPAWDVALVLELGVVTLERTAPKLGIHVVEREGAEPKKARVGSEDGARREGGEIVGVESSSGEGGRVEVASRRAPEQAQGPPRGEVPSQAGGEPAEEAPERVLPRRDR